MSLEHTLESAAHRIAEHGTHSESMLLGELAAAARTVCPGAAEALIDWNGPEVVRLRAFGIVAGALLRERDPLEHRAEACVPGVPVASVAA